MALHPPREENYPHHLQGTPGVGGKAAPSASRGCWGAIPLSQSVPAPPPRAPAVPSSPQLSVQSLDDGGEAAAGLVEVSVAGAEPTSQRVLRAERAGGRGLEPGGGERRGRGLSGGSAAPLPLSPPLSRCPRAAPRWGHGQGPPQHGHGPAACGHGDTERGLRPLRPRTKPAP